MNEQTKKLTQHDMDFYKIRVRFIRKGYGRLARKEYNVDGSKL
jgi:hypothetical protein